MVFPQNTIVELDKNLTMQQGQSRTKAFIPKISNNPTIQLIETLDLPKLSWTDPKNIVSKK